MAQRTEAVSSQIWAGAISSPARPAGSHIVDIGELAVAFKALADPTRVRIVSLLLAAGEEGLCVCDIGAYFPLGQPTISHHLRLLRGAGLVSATKKGLWVFYAARRSRLAALGISLPVSQQTIVRSECADGACEAESA